MLRSGARKRIQKKILKKFLMFKRIGVNLNLQQYLDKTVRKKNDYCMKLHLQCQRALLKSNEAHHIGQITNE